MALRSIGVRLTAEVTGFTTRMKAAEQSVKSFHKELGDKASSGHLDKLADRAGIMGLGLAAGFGYAVKAAADFDKQMSAVAVGVQDSTGHMKELRAAALQAGKDTQYSATQAAAGVTELGKAGITAKDILGGGLKGALSLAAAGQIDVAEAAETAASAMTQFKLSGDKVPHVADLLAAAAGKAQGSVHDMGFALNQSGLVAAQFGLSIEDTTGVLAEFANAGLIGSDAGTSFKTMLLAVANPSGVTAKKMQELGISFYDAQGRFIGLSGVAEVLRARLKNLTEEQRNQALGQIFGNDAIRAASILYSDGAAGVAKWRDAVNQSGYASQTAAKLTDNLAGDVERLKGSLETMAIESGGSANSGLRVLAKSLNSLVDGFEAMPPAVGSTVVVLAGIGAALALSLAAWIKLRAGIGAVVAELNAVGPGGEKAATGLQKVTGWAGKAGLAFVALEASAAVFNSLDDKSANVDQLTASLTNLANTGKTSGELGNAFGSNLDGFGKIANFADSANQGFGKFLNTTVAGIPIIGDAGAALGNFADRLMFGTDAKSSAQNMQALDQAFVAFEATQKDAGKAGELWNQLLAKSNLNTEQLTALLPGAWAGLQKLQATAHGAAGATGKAAGATGDLKQVLADGANVQKEYATAAESTAAAVHGERDALAQLSKQLKAETDPVFGLLAAEEALADAKEKVSAATKKYGKGSKEAAAANRELALAAIDLSGAVGVLGDDFNGKMTPSLRATLKAAGLTKGQINELAGQFKGAKKDADDFAGKYEAKASAPGAKQAKTDLDLAYTAANHFAGPYQAKASAPGAKQARIDLDKAYTAANHFAGPYRASISTPGGKEAEAQLKRLSVYQQALKSGKIPIGFNGPIKGGDGKYYDKGGWTGPGDTMQPAGVVHADEFVIKKSSRRKIEARNPGMLDEMNATGQVPGYAAGGAVMPFPVDASKTKIPTQAQAAGVVGGIAGGSFGKWPSSPGAQRGDSGVWRKIVALVKASGIPFSFGNGYRPGDPLWHGSGRAVDFMGFNQNRLADFFMARKSSVLELIHRTKSGDYGLTRGHYNAMPHQWPLHKNHLHVAMANGGVIGEHVLGVGRSGRTYEFGERGPERVSPMRGYAGGGLVNVAPTGDTTRTVVTPGKFVPTGGRLDTIEAMLAAADAVGRLSSALKENGRSFSQNTQKGRDNRQALISGIRAAQDAARAKYAETGSIKAANKVYADYLKALDASMKKMGVNAATRKALLKAYSEKPKYDVPEPTTTTITTPAKAPPNSAGRIGMVNDQIGVEQALTAAKSAFAWTKPSFNVKTATGQAELQQLFSFLSAAQAAAQSAFDYNGDAKGATNYYNQYIAQLKAVLKKSGLSDARINELMKAYARITLTPKANRWGGLYDYAADGMLTDAKAASAGSTLYGWREPSTGGELFAPKNGNLAKTRAEVGWAVSNWWGGKVNWQPGQGGGASGSTKLTINAPIQIDLGGEVITRVVRFEVDTAMGQVANAAVYQTA